MGVLCGWASIGENGKATGGAAGDQKQTSANGVADYKGEVKLGNWYNFGQSAAFLWKDASAGKKYAAIIASLCNNKYVGYNQSTRSSLYTELEKIDWAYENLTVNCNCDCSELVVCAINCLYKRKVLASWNATSTLNKALEGTGYFLKKTGSSYLTSSDYLTTGAILNAPGHHVISVLQNGSKAGTSTSVSVAQPTLQKGSTGSEVKKLQYNLSTLSITDASGKKIEADGSFGVKTREAVMNFQRKYSLTVDGSYGPKSAAKMKTLIK